MVWLMDEEHDQIPACLSLAEGGVHILASAMSLLHETELHDRAVKDLADFLARDSVLRVDLLNN